MIEQINISGHFILKDQIWKPLPKGVNIITSVNGGGKTSLLKLILEQYRKQLTIRKISQSITQFEVRDDLADYKQFHYNFKDFENELKYGSTEYQQNFMTDYKTLLELRSASEQEVRECNEFFEGLNLQIRIDDWTRNSGQIRFYRKESPNKHIAFGHISTGERTAFLLWLIMRSNPTPQVILLDEFDSGMDDDIIPPFYEQLAALGSQVQIFISTHRKNSLNFTHESKKNNPDNTPKLKVWNIHSETHEITHSIIHS
jgi:ABC-type multidrug transport system ATPase subunit